MIENFLLILGFFVTVVILLGIIFIIISLCNSVFEKHFEKGQQAQWEKDCDKLRNASRWFSEDPPTQNLIMHLAGYDDVSAARERWREARAKQS